MNFRPFHFLSLLCLSFIFIPGSFLFGQLTVQGGQNALNLANGLIGPGVNIFNVSRTCPNGASGTFGGTNSNIGLNSGVLLSTGSITDASGPNISGSTSTSFGAPGDPLLDPLAGASTEDACILEFDLIAACDTIQIAYVFASEEYPEFVNGGFNDAFGFFVSGPNPAGGTYNNLNIARVPGTNLPVTIDNVNAGNYNCPGPPTGCTNCAYYVDNCGGATVDYDGFTTPLIALAEVYPCSTYHIKLAVADAGDDAWDSGVFLEQGGIRCFSGQISLNTFTSNGDNLTVEGCDNGAFTITRGGDLSAPLTLYYTLSGSAVAGTDYASLPGSITFAAGQDSLAVPITPLTDGVAEGIESVFFIVSDTLCSTVFSDTATILISDPPVADFSNVNVCQGDPMPFLDLSSFAGGPVTNWSWDFGDGNTSNLQNPTHVYTNGGTFNVTLTVTVRGTCSESITRTVSVEAYPSAAFSNNTTCFFDTTFFQDLSTTQAGNIVSWVWDFGDGGSSTSPNPSNIYLAEGTYPVSLTVTSTNGCVGSVTQNVQVTGPPFTPVPIRDTVCNGFPAQLEVVVPSNVTVDWYYGLNSTNPFHTGSLLDLPPGTPTATYYYQATDDQGCRTPYLPIGVKVKGPPTGTWNVSTELTEIPNAIVEFTFTDPNRPIASYFWDFGDGTTNTTQNPVHQYTSAGTYDISLTLTDEMGCEFTYRAADKIEVEERIRLYAPSAFSPNDDGINDEFYLESRLISSLRLSVYDRWGRLVFDTYNPSFRWDGTDVNNEDLPEGVYMFTLDATAYNGQPIRRSGSVTLIR